LRYSSLKNLRNRIYPLIPTVRFGVTRAIYSTPFSDNEKAYPSHNEG
jgi:hypothetical protein